jgi:flagellar hook protein FlgE
MSFQTGLSGLNSSSRNLDVIGNNIANANTVGMKSSRAEFADLVASSLGSGGGAGAGIGVAVATISQQFTQGNINTTGNSLDVAINGGGFFQITMPDGTKAYTRDGQFKLDKDGNIITNTGANVMGYPTDSLGAATSITPQKMVVPTGAPIAAKPTGLISAEFNLDARAVIATSTIPPTPITTYGTSLTTYDSQGVEVPMNVYFVKIGPDLAANPPVPVDTWNVFDSNSLAAGAAALTLNAPITSTNIANYALNAKNTALNTANGNTNLPTYGAGGTSPVTPAIPASTANVATGAIAQMKFDATGKLTATTTGAGAATPIPMMLSMTLTSPNPVIGNFAATMDLTKVTQYGAAFSITNLTQDGYTAGSLTGLSINPDGKISTRYSNGQTQYSGQLALADFRNVQGLSPTGGGNWVSTSTSGEPIQGAPGVGKFGGLRAGAVEESNVDLTAELVNMMTAQRAYQANAQTIKTQDQVLSTLVNLR